MANIKTELTRQKILEALEECLTISEVAQKTGYSRKTIYSYLNERELLVEWRNLHRANLRQITERLENSVFSAIDTMINILDNEHTPSAIKLQTCSKIIEQWQNVRKLEVELNKRVFEETGLFGFLNGDEKSAI